MSSSKEIIRDFIVDNFLFGESEGLTDESSFVEEGIVDSTGILELVSFLEESFSIQIDDDELVTDNLDSINKIEQFLLRKRGGP